MKAIKLIENKEIFCFVDMNGSYQPNYANEIDNDDAIEFLQEAMVAEEEILGQDTYIFSDGSYITRLDDAYWTGADVAEFKSLEL